ncbi:hypothetical protein GLOIN_2v1487802 [Rhizophagus clarus]|uniref:Uncharacterized protein n=1 Tax=Rhizophagus clarus TaxID=94130 RepID=A0A8H3LJ44_9GLOM|nr:hypothetical protein GLOIN_2v1487802 [Rhizophagus clarus]
MTESSDEDSVISKLSYETNVDINEYDEYNALYSGVLNGPKDIYQEFPFKEYAEFMHIITKFHVQDSLANVFIKFFNKYSNRKDKSLPSTSQVGQTFIKNLQVPNLDWRREIIFRYKGIEYEFEYRTVLDALIISDWPEACAMGAIYRSSNSSYPYYFCLVDHNTLNNVHIKKEDIIIRNEHDTKNVLRQGNNDLILDKNLNKNLCDLFSLWIDMYIWNHKQEYTKSDLYDFEKLKSCICGYFQDIEEWSIQDIENKTIKINVCEFAYLNNNVIICATLNYYGQASFSDVCVKMDESEQGDYLTDNGLCYAKILLIIQVILAKLKESLELVLVYWYDFAYEM